VENALQNQAGAYTFAEMSEEWRARIIKVITVMQVCENTSSTRSTRFFAGSGFERWKY
jgi:hypothetical protein